MRLRGPNEEDCVIEVMHRVIDEELGEMSMSRAFGEIRNADKAKVHAREQSQRQARRAEYERLKAEFEDDEEN